MGTEARDAGPPSVRPFPRPAPTRPDGTRPRPAELMATVAAQEASLPDDAAPADQQVLVMPNNVQTDKTPDFYESVYERLSQAIYDILSEPLVRLNRDFEIIPAGALEWSHRAHRIWLVKTFAWENGNGCRWMRYGSPASNVAACEEATVDTSMVSAESPNLRHSSTCLRAIPPRSGA